MRPILIAGANGTLGRAFVAACERRGLAYRAAPRAELDIADAVGVLDVLDRWNPWLVINAAGYVRIDDAETDSVRCHRENTVGSEMLARTTAARAIQLVAFSSDLVFDGRQSTPYTEADEPSPLSVYGLSKFIAERSIQEAHPAALVVRTSTFFGSDPHNFVSRTLRSLKNGEPIYAASDLVVSATYVPDLVHACLDLAIDGERGLWHLTNRGATTWAELARETARYAGYSTDSIIPTPCVALGWSARRPAFSALGSMRGHVLRPLPEALERHVVSSRELSP